MKLKYSVKLTFLYFLLSCNVAAQNDLPDSLLSVSFRHRPMAGCLHEISNCTGISFAYKSSLIDTILVIAFQRDDLELSELLNEFLPKFNLDYSFTNRQVFLRKKPDKIQLKACILNASDSSVIPYPSLSLKGKALGTIADYKGVFEWELSTKYENDTIIISSMGYEKFYITTVELKTFNNAFIFLKPSLIAIEPVIIKQKNFRYRNLGNTGNRASGSIYIDTHGQQTGIHIKNNEKSSGQLLSLYYYLDEDGNTSAPFRVRIYAVDSISGLPDYDLLDEIIVAQPKGQSGWFEVDFSSYNLQFPVEGIFVALEGIFPNDYDFYTGSTDFIDISDRSIRNAISDKQPVTVSYGQRLGYNRRMAEYTWHYSLSHIWFQLRKQQYGVLIKAKVRYEKKTGRSLRNRSNKSLEMKNDPRLSSNN